MTELFLDIVNMSISAGWLVLAVLALRLILKKAPKWVNVLLWGIVSIRLICPFSIESALSLIPSRETISPEIMMDWTPEISTGIAPLDQVVNPVISTSFAPNPGASANPLQILIPVAANLWLFGVLILLAYTAISYLTLRHKLRTAVILRGNIFQCETVSSPFVLGILRPKIYLPYSMDSNNLNHVVAHEQAHIKRKDHWWKLLGFLLLTVYWFNPLMWLAYILLCRDIELACDEKVIAELGNEQRADYTQALVACAVNRRMIAACPLAFGEVGVKDRVKSIMNYRKPSFWIIVVSVLVCVVVAVCFLTNPENSGQPDLSLLNYKNAANLVIDQDEVMAIYCPTADESGSQIQIGAADGNELAKYIDQWNWTECKAPKDTLSSPGSVEFVIDDEYRIAVYQKKSGALRQYAVVKLQEDVRYYSIDRNDYADAVALVHAPVKSVDGAIAGKTYVYENEGILGSFAITLYEDGSFTYFEGLASSYIGNGSWMQEGDNITMTDDGEGGYGLVNHFKFIGENLVFVEQNSSNFVYVKVKDGERFYRTGEAYKNDGVIINSDISVSYLYAKVLEIHDGYYLVEPVEGSWELNTASKIEVPMKNIAPSPEPQVGDILEIEYDGQLAETYPARLIHVYSIKVADETRILSLNDVIILSQYGYDLSWSDFDDFEYIETGFGLYIRRYEINDLFHFTIGGAGPNSEPMYMRLGANSDDPDAYIDIRDGGVTEFISEHNTATVNFTGNLDLGLNAEIVEIDYDNQILYVKDINKSAEVFGDRCAIDCKYAISRYNLLYVNYGDPNDVRTIDFSTFKVGDAIIIGMYESEKEKAFNGSAIAEQVQLSTQRLSAETAFSVNFAGNTSLQQEFVLTEDRPYWCILVENRGTEKISTEIGGEVRKIEPGTFDEIFSDEKGKPGTYSVSFATSGSSGMTGNAVCYTYKYRIEITGRLHNAAKDTTYILLTNIEGITFEQAWKASGLSSNMDDYFDPADAVFIGIR